VYIICVPDSRYREMNNNTKNGGIGSQMFYTFETPGIGQTLSSLERHVVGLLLFFVFCENII